MTHRLHEFSELRQKDIFCDARIRVEDSTEFSVHRVILSASSDYFMALFRNKPKGNKNNNSYTILGIRSSAMKHVLDYIYDAKCDIQSSNMVELLVVSDYLGVLGMIKYCEDFIISAIVLENCVNLMQFGRNRDYPRIYEAAKLFILSDFVHIMAKQRNEMLDLSLEQFKELIEDDRLQVKQEDFVWEICLDWLSHRPDRQQSQQSLLSLMMACRLALVSPQVGDYLKKIIIYLMDVIFYSFSMKRSEKIRWSKRMTRARRFSTMCLSCKQVLRTSPQST